MIDGIFSPLLFNVDIGPLNARDLNWGAFDQHCLGVNVFSSPIYYRCIKAIQKSDSHLHQIWNMGYMPLPTKSRRGQRNRNYNLPKILFAAL